jgi:hypothetical protein
MALALPVPLALVLAQIRLPRRLALAKFRLSRPVANWPLPPDQAGPGPRWQTVK